jgi:hypothetical protein
MRCNLRLSSVCSSFGILLLVGCLSAPASAQDTATTIVPFAPNNINNGLGYSLGYTFDTTDLINVSQLGFYNPRGLTTDHEVGIFTIGGTLLASATVPAGSLTTVGDPLFSYVPIAPLQLAANNTYEIVGLTGTVDPYTWNPVALTTGPGITYGQGRFTQTNTLSFATQNDGNVGYWGPNFKYSTGQLIVTPEFGSVFSLGGLLAAGCAGVWIKRRRRS